MAKLVALRKVSTEPPTLIESVLSGGRLLLGIAANKLGLPGAVSPGVVRDSVLGLTVEVRVGPMFTVVSVNGRDFYYWRFSGRYDGSGSGCGCDLGDSGFVTESRPKLGQ